LISQAWPFLLVIILPYFNFNTNSSSSSEENSYFANFIIFLTVFSTVSSIVAYFKFYYYIKDDEFVIEKGFFQKVKINLPFDRIQTINFEQGPIHQLFNVVRLEVDSAGSVSNEIAIQAISRADAEYIRSYILKEKAKLAPSKEETLSPTIQEESPSELLMHHSPLDLLKIGVSQNHLRGLGIIFGFFFWIFQSIESFLPELKEGDDPLEYLQENLGLQFEASIWAALFITLIVFSVGISLFSTVFRYYDLKFSKTPQGFKVVSGLFTKQERSANLKKIQMIQWGDSILKRIFGIFRLYLYQASSAALSAGRAIGVPGCYEEQIQTVRATYFPNEKEQPYETHGISPLIIGRRLLYYGVLPLLLLLATFYSPTNYSYLLLLLWLPFIYFTSVRFHQNWKMHISPEGILTEQGIIGKEYILLQWYKVQSVSIRQSFYQQRKNVADIYFFTAAGNVSVPYLPLDKALALKNYVLYKVETDQREWM